MTVSTSKTMTTTTTSSLKSHVNTTNTTSYLMVGVSILSSLGVMVSLSTAAYTYWYISKQRRREELSNWSKVEDKIYGQEELHSMLEHFKDITLQDPTNTTVKEANIKRSAAYYEKARDAHLQNLVCGIGNATAKNMEASTSRKSPKLTRAYKQLLELRQKEMERIMMYWNEGKKSHRTILVMCDTTTSELLSQARKVILDPLDYNTDIHTTGAWIPKQNLIPKEDMHVTVAIPWWWHTVGDKDANYRLSKALASRFRQAVIMHFHHPFQIELDRIVLLGGKSLVALWRCVGERKINTKLQTTTTTTENEGCANTTNNSATVSIYDRHGDIIDPFCRLRHDIVDCFTTENAAIKRQPLTYTHRKNMSMGDMDMNAIGVGDDNLAIPTTPTPGRRRPRSGSVTTPQTTKTTRPVLERQNSIEKRTPGLGSGDGFIHTSLARLPLNCLSLKDIELENIHRLCREATAMYCGHRMIVSKFRFLETTGKGGESNPCVAPIYDEIIDCPSRVRVLENGEMVVSDNDGNNCQLHVPQHEPVKSSTVGALPASFESIPLSMDMFQPLEKKETLLYS